MYNTVSGKKIAFLGWAFKKDTNDKRESVAIYVTDYLLNENANIHVYDPKVKSNQMYFDLEFFGTRSQEINQNLLHEESDPMKPVKIHMQ